MSFLRFFHPRRFLRKLKYWLGALSFRVQCRINHVKYNIGENVRIWRCKVVSKKDGIIIIGNDCILRGAAFCFYGNGGRIELRDKVFINAYPWARTSFYVNNSSSILIENDCLFSNTIDVSTTDWHSIYDDKGTRLNPEKDVHIGQHVWIGSKVTVCKGVFIPDGSVCGACSVVTKPFSESNIIIAGNPAVIKKRGISWKH